MILEVGFFVRKKVEAVCGELVMLPTGCRAGPEIWRLRDETKILGPLV